MWWRNEIQKGFDRLLIGEAADYDCAGFWASNGQLWERRSLVLHVHDTFWQAEPSAEAGQGAGNQTQAFGRRSIVACGVLMAGVCETVYPCVATQPATPNKVRAVWIQGEKKPIENPNTEESDEMPGRNAAYHWLTWDSYFPLSFANFKTVKLIMNN